MSDHQLLQPHPHELQHQPDMQHPIGPLGPPEHDPNQAGNGSYAQDPYAGGNPENRAAEQGQGQDGGLRDEPSYDGKLFVGGISWQTTDDGLKYYFEKFGALVDVALMKDKNTGSPRGFGFVTFKDASGQGR